MDDKASRLTLHTNIRPSAPEPAPGGEARAQEAVTWTPLAHPGTRRGRHAGKKAGRPPRATAARRPKVRARQREKLTMGERLLRNAAIACALLLTVLAVKNLDQPWSRRATEGIRQAMTMRIDWNEALGKLNFVRALVPETALVFFHLEDAADLSAPVSGATLKHTYDDLQPWLEYRCAAASAVYAAAAGTVTAVGQGATGDYIVLLAHEDGTETVYGYLAEATVKSGQKVTAGEQIGRTAAEDNARLYFELRADGQSQDPSKRLK